MKGLQKSIANLESIADVALQTEVLLGVGYL